MQQEIRFLPLYLQAKHLALTLLVLPSLYPLSPLGHCMAIVITFTAIGYVIGYVHRGSINLQEHRHKYP